MGQRLLIVDSDRRFIKDHQVALEAAFEVDVLYGTDGVIQRLESGDCAAVLLCVEVAENKGYALCSSIRKMPALAGVKIALISAKATEEEYARHQSLKGRADLYLHKPMDSSSLVAALTPLVPRRSVDPDNPFGDADLGEEWLESLGEDLSAPELPEPPAPPAPRMPPPAPAIPIPALLPPKPPAAPKDAGRVELLDARVKDLETKLRDMGEALARKDHELAELQKSQEGAHRLEAERARLQGEVDRLLALLQDRGNAAAELEARLEAQAAELAAVQEAHARATRNLDEAERKQSEASGELQQRLKETEDALREMEQRARSAEAGHAQQTEAAAEAREALERLLPEMEGLRQEARSAVEELARAKAESEARVVRLSELEAEAVQRRDMEESHAREVDVLKVDIAGLEATLRGQRRELAEQGSRLGHMEREALARTAALEQADVRRQELEGLLAEREAALAGRDAELARAQQGLDELRSAKERLHKIALEREQELTRLSGESERQRLELLQGIDEREARLAKLEAELAALQERHGRLELEKRDLDGHLNERTARLEALSEALKDLENGIRRASDLTRPV